MSEHLPLETPIWVEYGYATLKQDDDIIYNNLYRDDVPLTVEDAENLAMIHPESRWKIILADASAVRHYERTGRRQWTLVKQDPGIWTERADEE